MPATDSHDGQIHGATPPHPVSADQSSTFGSRDLDVFKPGDLVGGSYEILDQLGRGAMGMVYKARHVTMKSEYAIKVLTTQQLNDVAVVRFQNEAQAIAKLSHPNIIAIYNFGLHDGRLPFYVMDLLYGDNLLDKLDTHGPMPVELALPVFIEVCAGLSYAHRKGILHRDVKPANFVILDTPDGRGAHVKVVDFGLVKFAEELKPDVQKLTAIGEVCGSPSYMSPEQSSGQKIDPRSDIYSLGCSLFQALTGKLPFRGRNATETMMMQHEVDAPTLASQGDGRIFPHDLERLVAKMVAKAPMDRYQSMESVAQDLKNILDGKALGTPPVLPADQGKDLAVGNADSLVGPGLTQPSYVPGTTRGSTNLERTQSLRRDELAGATTRRMSVERENAAIANKRGSHSGGKSKSDMDSDALKEESPAGKKMATLVVIAMLSLGFLGFVGFFIWQALHPAKPAPKSAQVVASPAASGDTISSKGLENTAMPMLDGENQPDQDARSGGESAGPLELTKDRFFSKMISVNGEETIEFDFPKLRQSQNLGLIATSLRDRRRIDGKVSFSKGAALYLVPSASAAKVPEFFEKFRPGEIEGIFLSPFYANDEVFICAARVPGIHEVNMEGCGQLTDKIIPSLSNLNLTVLHANGITIDGAQLVKAHFWQGLHVLELGQCKNVTPILKQLSGSRKLERLDLSGTNLNATDYQLIAKMPGLHDLNLSHNKLTLRDLHVLSGLPKLSDVSALFTRVTDGSPVEELRQFPALKNLVICRGYIKSKDLRVLKQDCPALRVQEIDGNQLNRESQSFLGDGAE